MFIGAVIATALNNFAQGMATSIAIFATVRGLAGKLLNV
jgi:hypothetical protein